MHRRRYFNYGNRNKTYLRHMSAPAPFSILYEDDEYVAIDKPWGILMHRTRISEDTVFVVQLLRDQLGQRVYPVHRLDRATSGVLVFGKTAEAAGKLGEQFMDKTVTKKYIAIVRGWIDEKGKIDYALADPDSGKGMLEAITQYTCLGQSEIDAPIGLRYPTARFSLVAAMPETGRRHQIRKHFAHINHPIIGDKKHGDVKQNTYFREVFQMRRMLLHASELVFQHPRTGEEMGITASMETEFLRALELTGLKVFCP